METTEHYAKKCCAFILMTKGRYTSDIFTAVLGATQRAMMDSRWLTSTEMSDSQVFVEPTQSITDDIKLVPELLHHAVDAGSVF